MGNRPWWRYTSSRKLALLLAIGGVFVVAVFGTGVVLDLAQGDIWVALSRLAMFALFSFLTVAFWINWRKLR